MKKTPFHTFHLQLGARMGPFAGFEMPLEYSGVVREHMSVRKNVGIFDVSHMGEIAVKGPGAFDLVQRLTTNDAGNLEPGRIMYTCLTNEHGGIVDDLLVYCLEEKEFLLVVNAANTDKDYMWVLKHQGDGTRVDNISENFAQLAVQGPGATELLQRVTSVDLSAIPFYHFVNGELAGVNDMIISNTGYTGSGGFELYLPASQASEVWERLFEAGADMELQPCGLGARDTLRLEMGYCLYGNDINDQTSPIEAGLGWITKFVEGNDFISREILEAQKFNGPERRLVGFILKERGIPRQHYPIFDREGEPAGEVTSGTMSPVLNIGIGMGYVDAVSAKKETPVLIGIRKKQVPARIVRPPFCKP